MDTKCVERNSLLIFEPLIQFRQRRLKHLTMPRITSDLQLLENPLPGKFQALPPLLSGDLLRSQRWASVLLLRHRLLLLLLNRLAFPSACHFRISRATKLFPSASLMPLRSMLITFLPFPTLISTLEASHVPIGDVL